MVTEVTTSRVCKVTRIHSTYVGICTLSISFHPRVHLILLRIDFNHGTLMNDQKLNGFLKIEQRGLGMRTRAIPLKCRTVAPACWTSSVAFLIKSAGDQHDPVLRIGIRQEQGSEPASSEGWQLGPFHRVNYLN